MATLEGIRIQNYRVLKDITLGRLSHQSHQMPLTPLMAVIGKNGTGKSTLFDVFGFLADCLEMGVEEACEQRGRGGFERLVSSGVSDAITIALCYRELPNEQPMTYELSIALDKKGRSYVEAERLGQALKGQPFMQPILNLSAGSGTVWLMDSYNSDDNVQKTSVNLTSSRHLGIATLGGLKEHPRISQIKNFIANWYLSYFTPEAARHLPLAGSQKHLNRRGDNIGNVVQFMAREHPNRFKILLDKIAQQIPGIEKIAAIKSPDGRLLLQFNDKGFQDPFFAQQMSDGTLKVFAIQLLLEDTDPPPLIAIEEPENGLYHQLLENLAHEFRRHATSKKFQIVITTHQPYFVDALAPEETWVLEKGEDGFAIIHRASDNPVVKAMVEEGRPLGSLWYSNYLDER